MGSLHRVRVCAIGSEEDMVCLCEVMLDNVNALPGVEDRAPFKLEELYQKIVDYTHFYENPGDTFSYNMIACHRFGDAQAGTCKWQIRQETCGLWSAIFDYDGMTPFQVHEWMELHQRCGKMLMVVQRASWDFGADKGELILTGGETLDNWHAMNECWLWLIARYECGYPPEEAAQRLAKLSETLDREDSDMTVDELLKSCMDNLQALSLEIEDAETLRENLAHHAMNRNEVGLLEIKHMVAEAALWEIEHKAKWLACLEAVQNAWHQHLEEAEKIEEKLP